MLRELCVRLAPCRPLNTLLRATQYVTEHCQLDSERSTLFIPPKGTRRGRSARHPAPPQPG